MNKKAGLLYRNKTEHSQTVILCTKTVKTSSYSTLFCGVVVEQTDPDSTYQSGTYAEKWKSDNFKIYNGLIPLVGKELPEVDD